MQPQRRWVFHCDDNDNDATNYTCAANDCRDLHGVDYSNFGFTHWFSVFSGGYYHSDG